MIFDIIYGVAVCTLIFGIAMAFAGLFDSLEINRIIHMDSKYRTPEEEKKLSEWQDRVKRGLE